MRRRAWGALVMIAALAGVARGGEGPAALVQRGNEAYRAGDLDAAVARYRESGTSEGAYNEGCVLLRQEKFDEAAGKFVEADRRATRRDVASNARFNLGLARFRAAERASDPAGALKGYEAAADAFRSVLDVDPGDAEAARHVELARRKVQELRDQERKKEEERRKREQQGQKDGTPGSKNEDQSSGQAGKDQSEQGQAGQGQPGTGTPKPGSKGGGESKGLGESLSDLAQRQQAAAERTGREQDQRSRGGGKDAEARAREAEDLRREQERLGEATERAREVAKRSAASSGKDPAAKEGSSKAGEALEAARDAQRQAERALAQQNLAEAKAQQDRASKLLARAAEAMGARERPEDDFTYDKTAQELLSREKALRDARRKAIRAERGIPVPVDKDW